MVAKWLGPRRINTPLHQELLFLFERAFPNVTVPDRSYFGPPLKDKNGLGVVFGGIWLVGYYEGALEMIVDEDLGQRLGVESRLVRNSVRKGPALYWLRAPKERIREIAGSDDVWERFRRATILADLNTTIRGDRPNYIRGKVPVSQLALARTSPVAIHELNDVLRIEVERSRHDSEATRLKRLATAPRKPRSVVTRTTSFLRNPDVIAQVLFRAEGECERCGKPAPFRKDLDAAPYLEVHHRIPLALGGDDTVENAIALCPNCHRHAHHGSSTYK
jgi:5-methylcytosine-specific restriction endonuclease McrA